MQWKVLSVHATCEPRERNRPCEGDMRPEILYRHFVRSERQGCDHVGSGLGEGNEPTLDCSVENFKSCWPDMDQKAV